METTNVIKKTPEYIWIDSQAKWQKLCLQLMKKQIIGVDLESNGYHGYPEKISLIQFATQNKVYLVDPFIMEDGHLLKILMEAKHITKIFHSCDNDVRSLQREYKIKIRQLFDTAVAAKFLGATHLGLANVLKQFLNISVEKDKKLQRQDWAQRPLGIKSLAYAVDDVAYLIPLKRILDRKLIELGRLGWVEEECKNFEKIELPETLTADELFWQVKGVGALSNRQRAILKHLCIFREAFALELGKPPYRILPDTTLLDLIKVKNGRYDQVNGLRNVFRYKKIKELLHSIQVGRQEQGIPLAANVLKKKNKISKKPDKRILQKLKQWRELQGEELGIDSSSIWPLSHLELFSARLVSLQTVDLFKPIKKWQKKEFKKSLIRYFKKILIELDEKG